ncbi:MAG: hypothetical protein AB2A00_23115 [Myxococcota bacterium]
MKTVHRSVPGLRSSFPRTERRLGLPIRRDPRERTPRQGPRHEHPEEPETTVIVIGGHPTDIGPAGTELRRHPVRISMDGSREQHSRRM